MPNGAKPEESDGTQIFEEGIERRQAHDEKRKAGTLKSGRSGRKVKSRKQAIAIGLSEARAKGKKVPKKASKKRKTSKKKTARKSKRKAKR